MKRRRAFSRRAKKMVRWFSNATTYNDRATWISLSDAAILPSVSILAIHKRDAVATSDLIENVQRHTIEAIRGELLLVGGFNLDPDASFTTCYHAGIRVVDLDGTGAPPFYSPVQPTEADDAWMWLYHTLVPPNFGYRPGVPVAPITEHQTVHVHVKSKRVMKDNQALVLYEQASPTQGADSDMTMTSGRWLRTLVSHPE